MTDTPPWKRAPFVGRVALGAEENDGDFDAEEVAAQFLQHGFGNVSTRKIAAAAGATGRGGGARPGLSAGRAA